MSQLTAIYVLDQKISAESTSCSIPTAWGKHFHILKFGRLCILYWEHFLSPDRDWVHCVWYFNHLSDLNVDPLSRLRESLEPLGVADFSTDGWRYEKALGGVGPDGWGPITILCTTTRTNLARFPDPLAFGSGSGLQCVYTVVISLWGTPAVKFVLESPKTLFYWIPLCIRKP